MQNSYIQVPVDDVGKKVAAEERTLGGETVEQQWVTIGPRDAFVAAQVDVGTSPAALPDIACIRIRVRALAENDGPIVIGVASIDLTANSYPLYPGEPIELWISNANLVRHMADAAGRRLAFLAEV